MDGHDVNYYSVHTTIRSSQQHFSDILAAIFATSLNFVFISRYPLPVSTFFLSLFLRLFSFRSYVLIGIYLQKLDTLQNFVKTFFFLLEVFTTDEFRVSRLQVDTLTFNEFIHWVYGQWFEYATNLLERARDKANQRSKGSHFSSVFGAVAQNPLQELETKQVCYMFRDVRLIQLLGNADTRVLELFHRVFDELATPLSFFQAAAYLTSIISFEGWTEKAGSVSSALKTTSLNKLLLFF